MISLFLILQLNGVTTDSTIEADIKEGIHDVQCIYNALSDIKAEVENVVKIGRKVVESPETDKQLGEKLTMKIDVLKDEFNNTGNEVSDRQSKFEKILRLSEKCHSLLSNIRIWLDGHERFLELPENVSERNINAISTRLLEMSKYKYSFVELNR